MDEDTLARVEQLAGEIRTLLGTDATLRLRTLAEMLVVEARRPLVPPKAPPPETSDEP